MAKTKEIVFRSQMPEMLYFLPNCLALKEYYVPKLLCVWLQADMSIRKHVDYILHICNQRTYIYWLTQLKRQGLPQMQLQSAFDAIIARVLYASPA